MFELLATIPNLPPASSVQFVGGATIYNDTGSNANVALPSGYQPGDLLIVIGHYSGSPPTVPAGYTQAFVTSVAPILGTVKRVMWKILANESFAVVPPGSYFDQSILLLKGPTSVSGSGQYLVSTGGDSVNFNSVDAGTTVIATSDRGSSRGADKYPLLPSENMVASFEGAGAFYKQKTGIYSSVENRVYSFADYLDDHPSSGLLFQIE